MKKLLAIALAALMLAGDAWAQARKQVSYGNWRVGEFEDTITGEPWCRVATGNHGLTGSRFIGVEASPDSMMVVFGREDHIPTEYAVARVSTSGYRSDFYYELDHTYRDPNNYLYLRGEEASALVREMLDGTTIAVRVDAVEFQAQLTGFDEALKRCLNSVID